MSAISPLSLLEGHRFPGGSRTVDHWENFLLTDCTASIQLQAGLVHPVAAFNMTVLGAGVSIADLFDLFEVADASAVWLEELEWVFERQLQEGVEYQLSGGVDTVERRETSSGRAHDLIVFSIDICEPSGDLSVRVTTTWRIRR